MSTYEVLARKYRPQQFKEVVGQDHIVRTLKNAITQKRIAHAYLFVGPRGTGKTTLARVFAKALNCAASKEATLEPCDECSNCKEIAAGTSMDVLEIDGASNNGIDQIRELRETVRYAPAKSRYKIIYIDEVHMVTTAAFNALLKTLEEPPPHVKFLFATTDPQKIPLTILSRCQRFDLRRIPNDLIIQHLAKIAKLEKVSVSENALLAIARGAAGGMRDAESALDQIIAFCGNTVEEQDVLSIFGLAAREQIVRLTDGILDGERAGVISLASSLSDEGKDLGKLLGELIEHFRNVLILQAGAEPPEIAAEELAHLKLHAARIQRARTLRMLDLLTEAENQVRWTLSKKVLFEITLIKLIETKDEVLLEEVLRKLKGLESNLSKADGNPSIERETKAEPPRAMGAKAPSLVESSAIPVRSRLQSESNEKKVPSSGDLALEPLWKELLERLARSKPMLKSNVMEGRPLSVSVDTLIIGFDPEFQLQKEFVSTPKSREMIQAVLREITHRAMNVKVYFADDPSIPQGNESTSAENRTGLSASTPEAMKRLDDDPLIQKALEIFKGQILEIRK